MAKRFIDTEVFKKSLLRNAKTNEKILWIYLFCDCTAAGIWECEFEVAEARIGCKIDRQNFLKNFKEKIFEIDNGSKWFIPDFLEFQYGELSEKNPAHKNIILTLKKHQLIDNQLRVKRGFGGASEGLRRGFEGVSNAPMDMDKEIYKDMEEVKEKEIKKEKEKIEISQRKIDLPFETPEFERAWQTWKRYKYEQHKFTYKSSVTEQTALGNLARLSGGKELTALKIIEQSISNGWQGFFELKNEQQNGTKSNEQRRQDLAEALMGEFGRTRNANNGSTGNTKV